MPLERQLAVRIEVEWVVGYVPWDFLLDVPVGQPSFRVHRGFAAHT